MLLDVGATLAGRPARLRVDPLSALNLLDPAHPAAAGASPAPPQRAAAPAGATVLDRAADLALTVAGRSFEATFYVAAWDLGGPDAVLGAPTLHRRGIALTADHAGFEP